MDFLKKWGQLIIIGILTMTLMGKGCTSSKVQKAGKNHVAAIDSLRQEVILIKELAGKKATKKEIEDEMERVMLNFLIYEDDLDKKKISLSQIKDKIESNDGE